jgi:L-iditol 2-dehydrogenase
MSSHKATRMKAAVYEGKESIQQREVDMPALPEGGLLLRVKACAICGADVRTFHHGHRSRQPPWIIGHEIAGQVAQVADGVERLRVGDRVTVAAAVPCGQCRFCVQGWRNMCSSIKAHGNHYPGGFAEYMAVMPEVIEQGAVNRIPDHVSYDEAAITEPLACVINGQELLNVSLGDTVAVIGAGPIGCMHVEVGRSRGANRTIHIELQASRLERAKAFGADFYINSRLEDPVEKVREVTDGQGADVVIVACPSREAQEQSLEMAAVRGRISLFGGLPKSDPYIKFNSNIVHYKEITVHGAFTSSPEQNQNALGLIAAGRINTQALITHKLSLTDLVKGIEIIERGEGLKVVVNP